jgi:hypothetical protein
MSLDHDAVTTLLAAPMELGLIGTPFDASYVPANQSRLTTTFANLARDPRGRGERIAATLTLIDHRFHQLMGESEDGARYRIALEILTAEIRFANDSGDWFPMTETLRCRIRELRESRSLPGPIGCTYSSYVRDHNFNIVLSRIRSGEAPPEEVASFGSLHGLLFRIQFRRLQPAGVFDEPLIIANSVSNGRSYARPSNTPRRLFPNSLTNTGTETGEGSSRVTPGRACGTGNSARHGLAAIRRRPR